MARGPCSDNLVSDTAPVEPVEPVVQLKEATQDFLDLRLITEAKVEYLPVVYVAPAPAPAPVVEAAPEVTAVEVEAPPAPEWPADFAADDYVPDDIKQRLIYHWLRMGPAWASEIVMQAPPVVPDDTPVVNPLYFPRPRLVGHLDDGLRRAIRLKL
jgi:hypothetical protein